MSGWDEGRDVGALSREELVQRAKQSMELADVGCDVGDTCVKTLAERWGLLVEYGRGWDVGEAAVGSLMERWSGVAETMRMGDCVGAAEVGVMMGKWEDVCGYAGVGKDGDVGGGSAGDLGFRWAALMAAGRGEDAGAQEVESLCTRWTQVRRM